MTDKKTPPDWVLREAAKRSGIEGDVASLRRYYDYHSPAVNNSFVALCDMIERYEQPPPDHKLLCAREAVAWLYVGEPAELEFRHGYRDDRDQVVVALRAIELWEEGFGK
jgi:hypothetical protein